MLLKIHTNDKNNDPEKNGSKIGVNHYSMCRLGDT